MAITASGLYGLTLEKILIDTLGKSLEAETNRVMMALDSLTPDFDLHDFENDITANEVSGTAYVAGGELITTTEVTLAAGVLTFDADNVAWAASTIANAMAGILVNPTPGTTATNQIIGLWDFVTAASTTNGTFTIQWNASGLFTLDYTP